MKQAKRISITIALVILIALSLTMFAGCKSDDTFGKNDFATIVVGTSKPTEYKVSLKGLAVDINFLDLLEAAKEEHGLSYKEVNGMLTEVGALKEDKTSGTYLYIYTSVEKDFDVSEYKTTIEYKETTLTSAGVGAKQMTIVNGAIIYVGTIVW